MSHAYCGMQPFPLHNCKRASTEVKICLECLEIPSEAGMNFASMYSLWWLWLPLNPELHCASLHHNIYLNQALICCKCIWNLQLLPPNGSNNPISSAAWTLRKASRMQLTIPDALSTWSSWNARAKSLGASSRWFWAKGWLDSAGIKQGPLSYYVEVSKTKWRELLLDNRAFAATCMPRKEELEAEVRSVASS